MPAAFTQQSASSIAFAENRVDGLPKDIGRLARDARHVLVVSDPGIVASGVARRITDIVGGGGLKVTLFHEVKSDPTAASVDQAADIARANPGSVVIGLGGGSALDVAKLAAAIAPASEPAEHYALGQNRLPRNPLPKIMIPTTAGTGSEVTRTSVITSADHRKLWAWGEELRADLALLDPTLTVTLPKHLTAATGVDAMVHAIEGCTVKRSQPVADANCLHAIRLITEHLPRAVSTPDDLEARGMMLIAAALAGLGFDSTGTGVAHAMGHALGALAGVHHGRAVGLCLRAALDFNAEAAPARHAAVARAMGAPSDGKSDAELAASLAAHYDAFLRKVELKIALDDSGLTGADAGRLAALTLAPENQPMCQANARALDEADAERIAGTLLNAA
ncbi:iron-containing alcohol dehydrogenase [Oceanibacterium hippocampi]|uniref:Alcohol dehydrogenase n=1 Tax=Oceanibacterium hippocampi TaxID=745714 RepID=A0A1Y5SH17_9PROT|nr:iron-containing alcohol dehydrogenase [Oceanibacterium hippocampi]SLN38914.1 Alcohol dehydrogenase [Oceanibacterium hippocampi]